MKKLEALEILYTKAFQHEPRATEQKELTQCNLLLRKALTPPTAKEVCEALSEYLENRFVFEYDNQVNAFFICSSDGYKVAKYLELKNKLIHFYIELPPYLITLIGKFYEGVKE